MDEHTLNDLLECSVCLERLDTSSKVLPCQHTFCRKCLEVIYASRQELRCPECRVLVDTKIDDLPPNVLLMRILEGMKISATKQIHINNAASHGTCDQIKEPPTNATINSMAIDERTRLHQQHLQQSETNQNPQFLQQHNSFQMQHQMLPASQPHSPPLQQQQNQQRRCIVPHAYALYDFASNESTDLKFKKGDLILLRRKIDSNWYVGQVKGVEGNFPINYVQVVMPLPSSQCVALYDFKMGPNEEEGCLTFKKGTVIQVMRRVDHNWAEGRIGSSIGIFPIAFVELNQWAKQLLENAYMTSASTNTSAHQHSSQERTNDMRIVPPIPSVDSTELSSSVTMNVTTLATSGPNTNSSSCSSSATNSPTSAPTNPSACSSTTTSSLFHSVPNSPQSSGPNTPLHSAHVTEASSSVRLRNNDLKHKRHSLNALLNNGATALSIVQTNRHSAEILSVPNDFGHDISSAAAAATGQTTAAREQQYHSSNLPQSSQQETQNLAQSSHQSSSSTPRHNILKTCVQQNLPPSLPWGYLALYPYKPRKNDELELKKGCVYMVTERCLDGWFKGKNWKDVSGVFPGNYVTPLRARDQHQLMHSWKLMPTSSYTTATYAQQQLGSQTATPTSGQKVASQLASNYSVSMRNDLENINARLTLANLTPHQPMPPDLPPRQVAASPTNVSSPQPQVESSKEMRDKEAQKEKPTTTGCMSTSSTTSSSTASSASAGLKKLLTHIKSRSKSPGSAIVATAAPATSTSNNNAGQQTQIKSQPLKQSQIGHTNSVTPVHVRSGSCPSQLLHTLPNEQARNLASESKAIVQPYSLQATNYGSQRIKGHKERPALVENSRPTIDSTLRSIYANHIQQQAALVPNKCGLQFQQQVSPPQANIKTSNQPVVVHRKSNSLDASNILQPSPLNNTITATASTSSLAGSGAAAVLKPTSVSQCNINAAAIHASATTKSTLNTMNESRFRCVVPYPPNSDVELELQVGDIIFVYRKQKNGWYKGTNSRTYKTGLFPASFVEPDL